jgi:hypothetical protein
MERSGEVSAAASLLVARTTIHSKPRVQAGGSIANGHLTAAVALHLQGAGKPWNAEEVAVQELLEPLVTSITRRNDDRLYRRACINHHD